MGDHRISTVTTLKEMETNLIPIAPNLTEDKLYHAMFSFCSDDRVWVRKTLETLEAEPFGLKCCIADRDFHPGNGVLQNIEITMQQSMAIILVLSPGHLESHYCDFEIGMAMELAHQKKCRVIPVLREGEQVPAGLRFINYIDARHGTDQQEVIDKLYQAIIEGADSKTSHQILTDPRYENGVEVRFTATRQTGGLFSMVPKMSITKFDECRMLGVTIFEHIGNLLVEVANTSSYILHHWYLFTHSGRASLSFMIYITIYLSLYKLLEATFVGLPMVTIPNLYLVAFLSSSSVFTVGFPVILLVWRQYEIYRVVPFCGKINSKLYKKNLLILIGDEKRNPVLRLVRYDVISCQEYIRENLVSTKHLDLEYESDDERLSLATEIIETAMLTYAKVLLDPSSVAPLTRHHVRRDKLCVCQYVEREAIHTPVINRKLEQDNLKHNKSRYLSMLLKMCWMCRRHSQGDDEFETETIINA